MPICTSLGNGALAKRVLMREEQVQGYLKVGLSLNNWNKLSVYMTPCLCTCMQRFKKNSKACGDFTL